MKTEMMTKTYRLEEIQQIARDILSSSEGLPCFAFYADMGGGKTTLISALGKEMGIQESMSSPTFSIVNEYHLSNGQIVYHMDWYRLKHVEDAIEAGVEDILLTPNTIQLIEWPSIAEELLPEAFVKINLTLVSEDTRAISWGIYNRKKSASSI